MTVSATNVWASVEESRIKGVLSGESHYRVNEDGTTVLMGAYLGNDTDLVISEGIF